MLAVVALAEQNLNLEHQVTKRKQGLVEVERKLQVGSSAALLTWHSALAKAEEARKICEELEDAEERFGVALVAASKARDNAKEAKEEATKFEADYIVKAGRR